MRLVFAGTPDVALPALAAIAASEHDLLAVVTRPDAPRRRSGRPVPSPVAQWAHEHGVRVLTPQRPGDDEFIATLTELAPDACPVVAYGALLPQRILDIPRYGWINLHFSLLPRWRGAAPVQRALMAGDQVTGATTFRLVRDLDAGPIFGSTILPLDGTETAGEVLDALAHDGADLLLDTLDSVGDPDAALPQDDEGITLAPKITVDDARLDWAADAREIDRLIRACSPSPTAWTTLGDERIRVDYARVADVVGLPPGELLVERRRVLVGTGSDALELVRLQPAGKKLMAASDWGRGLRGSLRFV